MSDPKPARTRTGPAHLVRRRPRFFRPVRLRARRDGWAEELQCLFLAELYATGSVAEAARRVGMSRMSAYRLKAREDAADFARAWDRVLSPPGTGRLPSVPCDGRKVTLRQLIEQVESGLVEPVIHRGRVTAIRRKHDNSALLRLLRRTEAHTPRNGRGGRSEGPRTFAKPPLRCSISAPPDQPSSPASTSYASTAPATAALSESARPRIGMVTRRSHSAS